MKLKNNEYESLAMEFVSRVQLTTAIFKQDTYYVKIMNNVLYFVKGQFIDENSSKYSKMVAE